MSKDTLSSALNTIRVAESKGQRDITLAPGSKLIREVLGIMQQQGYVGDYEFVDDGKSGSLKVKLLGRINKCGTVRPRSAVKASEWEACERRFLPSREVGLIVVSTSQGLMAHGQAKERNLGGRLLAFCY